MLAMTAAAIMMGYYVGAKAVRDSLFLSTFPVTQLPFMVVAAAGFSVISAAASSRLMQQLTPVRLVPAAFAGSAVLLAAAWVVYPSAPEITVVWLYLQIVGVGALLTSGFWTLVNESLDPRSAKRHFGRIAACGTAGGAIGGIVMERMGAADGATYSLPLLAVYHVVCAVLLYWFGHKSFSPGAALAAQAAKDAEPPWKVMARTPYLRSLAALVVMGTAMAGLVDFAFKFYATERFANRDELLRFFGMFYSATSVLTFLAQAGAAERMVKKLGIARTVGTVPFFVTLGGLGMLAVPGIISASITRALELITRGSLFRTGYELLYLPVPPRDKRAAKLVIDVGFDRMGDALGGGFVKLLLLAAPAMIHQSVIATAVTVAVGAMWLAHRMNAAYVGALEQNLLGRAADPEMELPQPYLPADLLESAPMLVALTGIYKQEDFSGTQSGAKPPSDTITLAPSPPAGPQPKEPEAGGDTLLDEIAALRSTNLQNALRVLAAKPVFQAAHVPHLIRLLAVDSLFPEALRALRRVAAVHIGQLTDALLDPDMDFAIRRRLPRVMTAVDSGRCVAGLTAGLSDKRFEVRYQCGRALSLVIARNPALAVTRSEIERVIIQELQVSRPVWESQRLLDAADDSDTSSHVDEYLRSRGSRSLEHVFTLLGLILPSEPLQIAFRGLHTNDAVLRGTALEYLESTLPPAIRLRLWPFLEDEGRGRARRDPQRVLDDLLKSNQSILFNIEELRKKGGLQ